MANYTRVENFTVKDSLDTGDPEKIITGADVDSEFNAIATAIGTKQDSPGSIPAGTKMLFIEDAAPSGWTLVTTYDDVVPLIQDSAATVSSAGNWTVGNTELTLNSPNHSHNHNHTHNVPNHTHNAGNLATGNSTVNGNFDDSADTPEPVALPNHKHNITGDTGNLASGTLTTNNPSSAATSNVSVNITKSGTMTNGNWRPKYVNTIICSKDS
jgi:hypothetical protein